MASTFGVRTPLSAARARAAILPHQLEPVLVLLGGARRVLLADEVGLGKTVQAGIVAGETIRRERSALVLVVVPAPLVDQWMRELVDRFGLDASAADRAGVTERQRLTGVSANPWRRPGVWVTSYDFVKQAHVSPLVARTTWDLVILDEAHLAAGATGRHDFCHAIGRRARRLLLLTATPHSGDAGAFERLAGLGAIDPGGAAAAGFDDRLTVFRRTRAALRLSPPRVVRWTAVRCAPAEARALSVLASFERAVVASRGAPGEPKRLLLALFRKRALSTFAALVRTVDRRLAWLARVEAASREPPWEQLALWAGEDADDESFVGALTARSGLAPADERRSLDRLLAAAREASRVESKIDRLVRLVARAGEPVVVFTEFRDSLDVVASALGAVRSVAVVHGGLPAAERRDALHRFGRGEATALVATDVAGQGLNLQQASRWVVSLELPWNPVRLEQRIGRVDRIGQRARPHFTLLLSAHDAERGLLRRLARRVLAAREELGADVLDRVVPSEAEVAAMVFDGAVEPGGQASDLAGAGPVGGQASGRVAPSGSSARTLPGELMVAAASERIVQMGATVRGARVARVARALAPRLRRLRALSARWRATAAAERPVEARLPETGALFEAAQEGDLAVYSVPLVDGRGALVARRLAGVVVPAGVPAGERAALLSAAARAAERRAAGAARRASRLAAREASRLEAVDRAILAVDASRQGPGAVQPGLFGGAAATGPPEAAASGGRAAGRRAAGDEEGARRAEPDGRAKVGAGEARLIVLFCRRGAGR